MEKQLVIFELGNENFGVDIRSVESIIKMQPVTRMPQAPSFVEGITNLRGKILPVIDLRQRFSLPSQSITRDSRIVVATMDGVEVGMVVDSVSEVLTIQDTEIEPAPPLATTIASDFIKGIAKLPERLVILLDLGTVLTKQERLTLQA